MTRHPGVMILAAGFISWQAVCLGQAISSKDLIAGAKELDGTNVTYSGEVIGDVMKRGDHAWINVSDGANAVGVWISAGMADAILFAGDFKHTGDIVEVSGIFNRACVQHGGDLDIHAQEMRVAAPGSLRKTCSLNKVKKDWVVKLLGVVAIVWILTLLKMR